MPVIGSSFPFSCAIDHDGDMRRSDCAFSDMTRSGRSAAVDMIDCRAFCFRAQPVRWLEGARAYASLLDVEVA